MVVDSAFGLVILLAWYGKDLRAGPRFRDDKEEVEGEENVSDHRLAVHIKC